MVMEDLCGFSVGKPQCAGHKTVGLGSNVDVNDVRLNGAEEKERSGLGLSRGLLWLLLYFSAISGT